MEALILVVALGGPTMFARIGVMRALNRHVERVFNLSRKETRIGDAPMRREAHGTSWPATANLFFGLKTVELDVSSGSSTDLRCVLS
jgi:hypothetical protein